MQNRLYFRESIPWLVVSFAFAAGMLAFSIFAAYGDDNDGSIAAIFWSLTVAAVAFAVKGILVIIRDLTTRQALVVAGSTLLSFILAIVLHNLYYGVTGQEEAIFFIIAIFIAPPVLIAAIIRAIHPGRGPHTPSTSLAA